MIPESALYHHLRFNHFPPIIAGEGFARAAIEAVNEGRGDDPLSLEGRYAPSAYDVVETWHLDFFLEGDEDDDV